MLSMENGELKMLADHMGHDLGIHTNIYQLQTSVIERSKVAKLLLDIEPQGKLGNQQKGILS